MNNTVWKAYTNTFLFHLLLKGGFNKSLYKVTLDDSNYDSSFLHVPPIILYVIQSNWVFDFCLKLT